METLERDILCFILRLKIDYYGTSVRGSRAARADFMQSFIVMLYPEMRLSEFHGRFTLLHYSQALIRGTGLLGIQILCRISVHSTVLGERKISRYLSRQAGWWYR